MASTSNFYGGADYGLDSRYDEFLKIPYGISAGSIGMAVDPRTANQIQVVTNQLNTGTKTVEVQMAMPEIAESIPNQHLDELNKLRKLIGIDLTVHGPLVEPTGVTRQGWDDSHRQQAERQMWSALERAKRVDPDGNVVVTFHSSNGLPEPVTKVKDEKTGEEKVTGVYVVDERNGQFSPIVPKENYLTGEKADALIELKKANEERWAKQLSHTSFVAHSGGGAINQLLGDEEKYNGLKDQMGGMTLKDVYKNSKTEEGQKQAQQLDGKWKQIYNDIINNLNYGEVYVREGYADLQNQFNEAYESAKKDNNKDDLRRLEEFKDEMQKKVKGSDLRDPKMLSDLSEEVLRGVNILNTIQTPQLIRPLRDFAIDKASETFSNLAMKSYKEFGEKAPIISIENPPAGSGLNRADDLRDLIKETRKKFVENSESLGLSKTDAEKQADKLIGVTWDIGHINMIKKFGYDDTQLGKETETIKPFLKHLHLSDNFGMEHTELPMGMGNVPTKKHLEIINDYQNKIKKIVETGQWYQHFKTPPFGETLAAFGSPIYAMQMAPTWNQAYGRMMGQSGSYFAGYGMNPDIHHTIYGAGFSGLPLELGGQIAGRSRLSGTSME